MITRAASRALPLAVVAALTLGGCAWFTPTYDEFTVFDPKEQRLRDRTGTVTGQDGITLFSSGNNARRASLESGGGGGIGVNAFLWRGALETLNFMPLASADPFGGLIITDWYQPATAPDERLKVHVLILDRTLRADAVKVSVFRQRRDGRGEWIDEPVDPKTAVELEDKILTKARELRIASVETQG
jgi:hypothetical protein